MTPNQLAFPANIKDKENNTVLYSRGMTKREVFAAVAMLAMILKGHEQAEAAATKSLQFADALYKILTR